MSGAPEIVDIHERIADHFPIGEPPFVLEVVPGATGQWARKSEPAAVATVRTISWERVPETGAWTIRDIKEQELHMGWPALYADSERVAAFFAALATVVGELAARNVEVFDGLMPCDLMCTDALELRRARTKADFEAALRAKRRLGRFF